MKVFGLIGYPLDHSWSPDIFGQKFREHQLHQCSYRLFPLTGVSEFPGLLDRIPDLCGVNVTIPYKEAIIPFLDELDPVAAEIGAVNSIRVYGSGEDRRLVGFNTDALGFRLSADFSGHNAALILGTGGAARAVAYVLKSLGIPFLFVSRGTAGDRMISYPDLDSGTLRRHTLIVNATPVGMHPDTGRAPDIPYESLTTDHFLYDLVYNPEETRFLSNGMMKGARTQSGLQMLRLQAEASFRLFTDQE